MFAYLLIQKQAREREEERQRAVLCRQLKPFDQHSDEITVAAAVAAAAVATHRRSTEFQQVQSTVNPQWKFGVPHLLSSGKIRKEMLS